MHHWTTLHDLAFLYVFLAENLDHDLASSERQAIVSRLSRWAPARPPEYLTHVLREVHDAASGATPGKTATETIDSLKYASLSDSQRAEIWRDLRSIAESDGTVNTNERAFLLALARVWNIEQEATALASAVGLPTSRAEA